MSFGSWWLAPIADELIRWVRTRLRGYVGGMALTPGDEHIPHDQAVAGCPGQWVAVDRRSGRVVAARETPYELAAYLKGARIRDVDVVRVPAEHEPEMVGFG